MSAVFSPIQKSITWAGVCLVRRNFFLDLLSKAIAECGRCLSCGCCSGGDVVPGGGLFAGVTEDGLGGHQGVAEFFEFGCDVGTEVLDGDVRQVRVPLVVATNLLGD